MVRKEHQTPKFIIERKPTMDSKETSLMQPAATEAKHDSSTQQKDTMTKEHQAWVPGLDISRTPKILPSNQTMNDALHIVSRQVVTGNATPKQ